ncbi:hypothetical protein CFP66_41000 [Pseudonocardia sp. MH-G8]|nr:hypothetical protein CFP66_41000 [Pseudonocardia sp. MH-G8]
MGRRRGATARLVTPELPHTGGLGRHRTRVGLLVAAATLVSVVCWVVGLDAWHAATAGLVLVAAGLCWTALPAHRDVAWPQTTGLQEEGARWDVARLSWSLRPKRGRVPHAGLRPVQDIARRRLAPRGLDLGDPRDRRAIEHLIGEAAYATLALPANRPPHVRAVQHCLDALDRLDPTPAAEGDPA